MDLPDGGMARQHGRVFLVVLDQLRVRYQPTTAARVKGCPLPGGLSESPFEEEGCVTLHHRSIVTGQGQTAPVGPFGESLERGQGGCQSRKVGSPIARQLEGQDLAQEGPLGVAAEEVGTEKEAQLGACRARRTGPLGPEAGLLEAIPAQETLHVHGGEPATEEAFAGPEVRRHR
jgi:hypothetical protein